MAGKKNGNGHAPRTPTKYRTYIFKGDRDPAMDDLRSVALNEGVNDTQLHVMSGVSTSTFNNWWNPKAKTRTMRPTHACLAATAGALGYEYQLVRRTVINIDEEIEKGQRWLDKQQRLKKKEKDQP